MDKTVKVKISKLFFTALGKEEYFKTLCKEVEEPWGVLNQNKVTEFVVGVENAYKAAVQTPCDKDITIIKMFEYGCCFLYLNEKSDKELAVGIKEVFNEIYKESNKYEGEIDSITQGLNNNHPALARIDETIQKIKDAGFGENFVEIKTICACLLNYFCSKPELISDFYNVRGMNFLEE